MGLNIFEKGGMVIEVMVVVVVFIVVEYFYMNGLGGDGFWLISEFGKVFIGIDVLGIVVKGVIFEFYVGLDVIFSCGGKVVLIMVGVVVGWNEVLKISYEW